MDGQLARADALPGDRVGHQGLGQFGALGAGQHPAGDGAVVDVDNDIEVEQPTLGRPEQFRYVPAPYVVRPGGDELGILGRGGPPGGRSRTSAWARKMRAIVEVLTRYLPSSSSLAYTVAGVSSTRSGWRSTSSTIAVSASDSARGCGLVTRPPRGLGQCLEDAPVPLVPLFGDVGAVKAFPA